MTDTVWAIDCTEGVIDRGSFPSAPPVIFAYKTGTVSNPDIAWTEADIAQFPWSHVYRIHQGFGIQNAFRTSDGMYWDEADMEAGAWSPGSLLPKIAQRNTIGWSTRVYASDEPWLALVRLAGDQGVSLRSVFWREANWSLSREEAQARIGGNKYAVQWASPTSNPDTLVPGMAITLGLANVDLDEVALVSTAWRG